MPAGWSLFGICAVLAVNGFGVGTMYPFTTVVIQNAVAPHQFGIATGTLNFFRQLGGAIIVAVFVAIVLGGFEGGEGARLMEMLTRHGAGGAARAARAGIRAAVLLTCSCAAALCIAAAMLAVLAVEERPLRGPATRVKVKE